MNENNALESRKNKQVVSVFLLVVLFLFVLGMWSGISTADLIDPVESPAYMESYIVRYQTGTVEITHTVYFPFLRRAPTPTPSPTPTPIYRDDFSNSGSGWQGGTSSDKDWCKYEYGSIIENSIPNGVYRMTVTDETDKPEDRCIALNFNLPKTVNGEFTVRVRRTTPSSRKIHYGFYFAAGTDAARNHWYLQVYPNEIENCDGSTRPYFWLSALNDRNSDGDLSDDDDVSLNYPVCTDTIKANLGEWNVLKVRRNGANVEVFINGTRKKSVSNNILENDGFFNLVIWGFEGLSDSQPAIVEFDYVLIDILR